jgi:hypothetical protein
MVEAVPFLIHKMHILIRKLHHFESGFGGFEGVICRRFAKFTRAFYVVDAVVAVVTAWFFCQICRQRRPTGGCALNVAIVRTVSWR